MILKNMKRRLKILICDNKNNSKKKDIVDDLTGNVHDPRPPQLLAGKKIDRASVCSAPRLQKIDPTAPIRPLKSVLPLKKDEELVWSVLKENGGDNEDINVCKGMGEAYAGTRGQPVNFPILYLVESNQQDIECGSESNIPHGYIWSPHLVPKPKDWGPKFDVVRFCFLDLATNYEPPESLLNWLKAIPKPIYIGFGSLGGVQKVHLLDDTIGGILLKELFQSDGIGTMVASDLYEGIRTATISDLHGIQQLFLPLEEFGTLIKRTDEELLKALGSFIVAKREGQDRETNYLKASSLGLHKLFLLTTRTADWFVRRGFSECSIEYLPEERRKKINISRRSKYYIKRLLPDTSGIRLNTAPVY
ncbi:Probable amino-acid acetyltransferase NAGS2-chloroplastic [Striga hermonthica]|uniref:Probable amino-acid acetyltransferase NAGS2-chloroplastic n=1 Tax=Striga hermonthica TaxID=68872 RepID=A0A9N7MKR0_STRHE|nr:Probable amino-acid acetyltransferase NAGS2-chloroplastic [Striga hermonthica]